LGIVLSIVLVAIATFSGAALWRTFGPHPAMAPDFTLIDQNGQPFTLSSVRGHPIALFFGFTHCPDECPTTLAHLAHAVHAPGVPHDTRVAFITVDPGRDSPATLKRYVRLFDPQFIGLTGALGQLNPVYDAYHTARQAVPVNRKQSDDSFEHGTTVFYVGRDGTIKGQGQWDDVPAQIARDFRSFR
jgi:protein SCO1/2